MHVLVVGGTGATGRHLVDRLLAQGYHVTVVARAGSAVAASFTGRERLTVVTGNVLDMDAGTLRALVQNIDGIGSCLGHPMTLKGTFGEPKRLVTESIQRLCQAVQANDQRKAVRLVLMNTTGVLNKDSQERWPLAEGIVFFLLRTLVPQHSDNENVVGYLRSNVGKHDPNIAWAIVRPDKLVDDADVSAYTVVDTIKRSPLFNGGSTSRINVGDFMADLLVNRATWDAWQGKMPVIYNSASIE